MSDMEKVFGALDRIEAATKDFEKSSKAEVEAAQKGIEKLTVEIAEVRKQNQELAEVAKRQKSLGKDESAVYKGFGEMILKAASEGTAADGGYLVADEWNTQIKSVQNEYGIVRQLCDVMPMSTDYLLAPVDSTEETSGNVPVPAATSENGAITESDDAQLDQVALTAQKYATLNYMSNELLDDAFVDYIGAYYLPKIARQAAKIEDQVVFSASSTGLLNSTNVPSVVLDAGKDSFADVDFDALQEAIDTVYDGALNNAKFIGHRSVIGILRMLKGTDGQLLWAPAGAGTPSSVLGYDFMRANVFPARSSTNASTAFILFGDPRMGCVCGERLNRRIVTDSSVRFNYDQTAIRMTFRFAFNTNANIGHALCRIVTAA